LARIIGISCLCTGTQIAAIRPIRHS
jgi:hypothetical protein